MSIESTEKKTRVSRSRIILSQVIACLALDVLLIGLGLSISFVTMVLPDVLDAKEGLSITKQQASWFDILKRADRLVASSMVSVISLATAPFHWNTPMQHYCLATEIGSVAFLCQPLGSIFSGPLLDYFGRKKALFIVNIPHLMAWILLYFANDVPTLFLSNALLGIGTGIMEAPSITYVGEISDAQIRGTLTTLTNCFTSAGIFIAYLLGTVLPWRQAALVSLSVPLATMGLVLLVPETPIWLLSKGRQKEALHSLCRIRGWVKPEEVKEEFDELLDYSNLISQCVLCNKEGKVPMQSCEHTNYNIFNRILMTLKHVFFVRETLRPFVLVMAYFFFHSMSGFISIRPNMVNFCKALGMKYDAKTLAVIVGLVLIVMNLVSTAVVKTIGKRKLILSSLLATAACSMAISIYSGMKLPGVFSYETSTFPDSNEIVPVFLFIMLVSCSSLGIPWVLLSEVFPFRSRGIATSLAAAFTYIIFFLATKTNYNLEANLHLSGTFMIYAIIGLIGTVYLYFFLPETECKTLAEIEACYKSSRKIFADDFFINAFRKKSSYDVDKPMLVQEK